MKTKDLQQIKWGYILTIVILAVTMAILSHLESRIIRVKLEILLSRQTSIIAHLAYPPELQRVYYDPACDTPKEPSTEIQVNEKLLLKKKNRGGKQSG